MNCPNCSAVNDDQNIYCVNCGETIVQNVETQTNLPPPTQFVTPQAPDLTPSVDTVFSPKRQPLENVFHETPDFGDYSRTVPPVKSRRGLMLVVFGFAVFLIVGTVVAGLLIWNNQKPIKAEVLPDHLGLFLQTGNGSGVAEIKKLDVVNAFEAKKTLTDDGSLPVWEKGSGLVLFADASDVPVTDLKLIPLKTITDDGKYKQIDFQAAPVEGTPEMKRLRLPETIADGKYVFALLDGFLDEGKHKFWAFQVNGSGRGENTENVKDAAAALKDPSEDRTAKQVEPVRQVVPPAAERKAEPPAGARVAYCNASNVVLRGSPSLQGRKIGGLSRGQRLYVVEYSNNYDNWRGTTANWANVQTESGKRGWVFTPFVSY